MLVQTSYMLVMGSGLLFFPNVLLTSFGAANTHEVWIRLFGAVLVAFGSYYYLLVRQENLAFYKATVWGRYWFCGCMIALTAIGIGEMRLYFFAALELSFTVWAHVALRSLK